MATGEGRFIPNNKMSIPEVFRLLPDQTTGLECAWVYFWKGLNPQLTNEEFVDSLMDQAWAWMNNTGVPPRYNCFTGEGSGKPAFHAPLVCGGALLRGVEKDADLWIDCLLTSMTPPDPAYVLEHMPWLWYYGTAVGRTGNVSYMTKRDIRDRVPTLVRKARPGFRLPRLEPSNGRCGTSSWCGR